MNKYLRRWVTPIMFSMGIHVALPQVFAESPSSNPPYLLWEPEPAPNRGPDLKPVPKGQYYPYDEDWEKWSYPIGNGNIGANIFGRTDVERIQISEKTFANEGLYRRGGLTSAAEIFLEFGHNDFSDYRRELNLNEAVKTVTYQSGGTRFLREYFTSYPDDVLVVRLEADRPGALSLTVRPEIPYVPSREANNSKTAVTTTDGNDILLTGTIDFFNLRYSVQVRVLHEGGELITGEKTITVKDADEVTLLVAVATNYKLGPEVFLRDFKEKLDPSIDPVPMAAEKIQNAEALGYEKLKSRHVADHRALFERVAVDLGSEPSPLPTHELLEKYQRRRGRLARYRRFPSQPRARSLLMQRPLLLINPAPVGCLPSEKSSSFKNQDSKAPPTQCTKPTTSTLEDSIHSLVVRRCPASLNAEGRTL
jgi:alpha-L-fucosidase 2